MARVKNRVKVRPGARVWKMVRVKTRVKVRLGRRFGRWLG